MPIDRLIPESVYEKLPGGPPLAGLYSQVVRATGEAQIHVSGTVAADQDGEFVGRDDMERQVEQVVENVEKSLAAADADLSDVIRTRVYTVDVDRYVAEGIGVYQETFGGDDPPASTLVGVDRLANPDFLVEIEAVAVSE